MTEKDEIEKLEVNIKDDNRIKQLEEQNKNLKAKLQLIAEQKLEAKRKKLIEKGYSGDLKTIEQVRQAEEEVKNWKTQSSDPVGRGGKGNLPLDKHQTGETDFTQVKYPKSKEGFRQMMSDLKTIKETGNPEESARAQAIQDELLKKAINSAIKGERFHGSTETKLGLEPKTRRAKNDGE